jgi:hypothetical protein
MECYTGLGRLLIIAGMTVLSDMHTPNRPYLVGKCLLNVSLCGMQKYGCHAGLGLLLIIAGMTVFSDTHTPNRPSLVGKCLLNVSLCGMQKYGCHAGLGLLLIIAGMTVFSEIEAAWLTIFSFAAQAGFPVVCVIWVLAVLQALTGVHSDARPVVRGGVGLRNPPRRVGYATNQNRRGFGWT